MDSSCLACKASVRIPAGSAWPERCPYCGSTPLAVVHRGGPQLSPVGAIDPMKAANAAIRVGSGFGFGTTQSFQTT